MFFLFLYIVLLLLSDE